MKIGIVGNRAGWTYSFVKEKLLENGIYHTDVIISGGAEGVDTFAQMFAKEFGNNILILYPKPHIDSPDRYFKRNTEIALTCDVLVAFDKGSNGHSGTLNTINTAKKAGKKVILYDRCDE